MAKTVKLEIEFQVYGKEDKIPANKYQVSKKTGDVFIKHDTVPLADIGIPEGIFMRVTKWGTLEFSEPLVPKQTGTKTSGVAKTREEMLAEIGK